MVYDKKVRTFCPKSLNDWREWLSKNHLKKDKVFLVKFKKHTGKFSLTNREAMDEAICFGWIDTTVKHIDDERYCQTFVRRNSNSRWSNNTLSYAKRLINEGRMTPNGLKLYEEGLKKPTIDHNIPKNPNTPKELLSALKDNNLEKKFFSLAPSYRRTFIIWFSRAKQEETKNKRINIIIDKIKNNKNSPY